MPPRSIEDTMIRTRPTRSGSLYAYPAPDAETENTGNVLERCRALFRHLGERVSSFDLSRQIYG